MDGSLRGVPIGVRQVFLAPKLPTGVGKYTHRLMELDALVLSELSLAAAPSGAGELAISALSFASGIVTFIAAAGQPSRCYTLLLTATRSDGLVSDYIFKINVDCVLSTDQAQAAPSAGFGTALTWTA